MVFLDTSYNRSYLVALRLGDSVQIDTLFAAACDADFNPAKSHFDFICSMRDSLFLFGFSASAGQQRGLDTQPLGILWRLTSEGTWEIKRRLPPLQYADISGDFSQMYFVTIGYENPPYHAGTLLVFDIATELLARMDAYGGGITMAKRRSKSEPLFFLKRIGDDANIWMSVSDSSAERLTEIQPPYYIWWFKIERENIEYRVTSVAPDYYPRYDGGTKISFGPPPSFPAETLRVVP